jgi:hypothetical protein
MFADLSIDRSIIVSQVTDSGTTKEVIYRQIMWNGKEVWD